MTCTESYKEHIMYTFHGFCKVVIRNAAITAWRDQHRRHKREISLEYLTEERFYPLGTTDEYFEAPYEEKADPHVVINTFKSEDFYGGFYLKPID